MAMQYKFIDASTFGWQRILRNTERFGWKSYDVERQTIIKETTTYEEDYYNDNRPFEMHTHTTTRTIIEMSFHRDTNAFSNLNSIFVIELIYNIIFVLRVMISKLLTLVSIIAFIGALAGGEDLIEILGLIWITVFASWRIFIHFENSLSRIAQKILKPKFYDIL